MSAVVTTFAHMFSHKGKKTITADMLKAAALCSAMACTCAALHVFDAEKLKGDITVRMAKDGEKFVSLEDKEYMLDDKSLGICDEEGV